MRDGGHSQAPGTDRERSASGQVKRVRGIGDRPSMHELIDQPTALSRASPSGGEMLPYPADTLINSSGIARITQLQRCDRRGDRHHGNRCSSSFTRRALDRVPSRRDRRSTCDRDRGCQHCEQTRLHLSDGNGDDVSDCRTVNLAC